MLADVFFVRCKMNLSFQLLAKSNIAVLAIAKRCICSNGVMYFVCENCTQLVAFLSIYWIQNYY